MPEVSIYRRNGSGRHEDPGGPGTSLKRHPRQQSAGRRGEPLGTRDGPSPVDRPAARGGPAVRSAVEEVGRRGGWAPAPLQPGGNALDEHPAAPTVSQFAWSVQTVHKRTTRQRGRARRSDPRLRLDTEDRHGRRGRVVQTRVSSVGQSSNAPTAGPEAPDRAEVLDATRDSRSLDPRDRDGSLMCGTERASSGVWTKCVAGRGRPAVMPALGGLAARASNARGATNHRRGRAIP